MVNSVNGGREGDEGRSKKEEKRDMMKRGAKIRPPHKSVSWVAESTPKKKTPFLFHS